MPNLSIGHTPLRDDQTHVRSLSLPERSFIRQTINESSTRLDGRSIDESRPILLTFRRSHGHSSTTTQFGSSTRSTSSVSAELIPPPNPERPNDGQLRFNIELSPMACMGFDTSEDSEMQSLLTNRISRILEKMIREGGAIDSEALCVQSGAWVWRLNINVVVLDHGGNLVDCAILSAIAALCHFRLPVVSVEDDKVEVYHADDREPAPLPLHHVPVPVTFALFGDVTGMQSASDINSVMDPTDREEMVCEGTMTFCFNVHGELCCLDFPGGCEILMGKLMQCAKMAEKKAEELCQVLEKALKEADDKSQRERMERIKGILTEPETMGNVPYEEISEAMEVEGIGEVDSKDREEEERYRMQALDYSIGHIAAKVKENDDRPVFNKEKQAVSSLMEAMLKAASAAATSPKHGNADDSSQPMKIQTEENESEHKNEQEPMSINRTKEADDEFTKYAAAAVVKSSMTLPENETIQNELKESASNKKKESSTNHIPTNDTDDEEEVTILHSEFTVTNSQSISQPPVNNTKENSDSQQISEKEAKDKRKEDVKTKQDDDDFVDLAMAIKKKKGSKKKKTTKKK